MNADYIAYRAEIEHLLCRYPLQDETIIPAAALSHYLLRCVAAFDAAMKARAMGAPEAIAPVSIPATGTPAAAGFDRAYAQIAGRTVGSERTTP